MHDFVIGEYNQIGSTEYLSFYLKLLGVFRSLISLSTRFLTQWQRPQLSVVSTTILRRDRICFHKNNTALYGVLVAGAASWCLSELTKKYWRLFLAPWTLLFMNARYMKWRAPASWAG